MTTQTSQIGHLAPIAYTAEDAALVSAVLDRAYTKP